MADQYVEVTQQGWGGRIKNAFGGILVGILMTVASFPVLFLNEGRAVKRHQSLQEGAGIVVSVAADRVDPAQEGRLVHVTGNAEARGDLKDPEFGVSVPGALKLRREVEMYQWVEDERTETRNKVGGGTERVTTYHYDKKWKAGLERSSQFKQPTGHQNPDSIPYSANQVVADPITVGAFSLPEFFVSRLNADAPVAELSLESAPEAVRASAKLHDGAFYFGANPSAPNVGDVRVTFSAVHPGLVSLVAKQAGNTFEKYRTAAGGDLDLLEMGTRSPEEMFAAAEQANKVLTWILRAAGFLLMALGLGLVARPLRVMADVLPMAGRVVGMGIGLFAFIVAGIGSTVTIAVAWIFYRPLIGISVLVLTVGLMVWLVSRLKRAKTAEMTPPPLA